LNRVGRKEKRRQKRKNKIYLTRDSIEISKMPSIRNITGCVAGLVAVAAALPAQPKLSTRQNDIYNLAKRQNAAAAALGLADVDILQL
jgi:hypothetical protein